MAVSLDRRRHGVHRPVRRAGRPARRRAATRPAPPEESFGDDPLRMLRAARFVAQLGFTPAPRVVAAMTAMAGRAGADHRRAGAGRAGQAAARRATRARGLELLVDTGLADVVLPELPALRLEIDEHHQHKDVYEHSLTVLRAGDRPARRTARTWCCGWPRCCTTSASRRPGGTSRTARVSFHHHEVVGREADPQAAARRCGTRRTSIDDGRAAGRTCTCASTATARGEWTDSAVRRYVTDAGPLLPRLHKLVRVGLHHPQPAAGRGAAAQLRRRWRADRRLAAQEELGAGPAGPRRQRDHGAARHAAGPGGRRGVPAPAGAAAGARAARSRRGGGGAAAVGGGERGRAEVVDRANAASGRSATQRRVRSLRAARRSTRSWASRPEQVHPRRRRHQPRGDARRRGRAARRPLSPARSRR